MKTFTSNKKRLPSAARATRSTNPRPVGPIHHAPRDSVRRILRDGHVQAKPTPDRGAKLSEGLMDAPYLQRSVPEAPEEEVQRQPEEEEDHKVQTQRIQRQPTGEEDEESLQTMRLQRKSVGQRAVRQSGFGYLGTGAIARQADIRRILRSAGVQAKLAVGPPDDKYEAESDRIADQVMAMPARGLQRQTENDQEEESLQAKPLAEQITPLVQRQPMDEEEEVQTELQRQQEEEEVQSLLQRQEEEEEVQPQLQRQEEEEEIQPWLQRQDDDEETAMQMQRAIDEEEDVQTRLMLKAVERIQARGAPDLSEAAEQRIGQMRGLGDPLPEDVRQEMENKIGADFSDVSIHANSAANDINQEINARAFTLGNDIFFAAGQYAPTTRRGKRLLAHELTHVVQQNSAAGTIKRSINPADTPSDNTEAQNRLADLSTLMIPPIKQRHLPLYTQLAESGNLGRIRNYTRRRTAQTSVWKQNTTINEEDVATRLGASNPTVSLPTGASSPVNFRLANHDDPLSYTKRRFLNTIMKIPKWDRDGNYIPQYQVDHIVELQTSGARGTRNEVGNTIQNMELLDQPSNSSSGGVIMNGIYNKVDAYLNTLDPKPDRTEWLRTHDVMFERVAVGRGGSRTEIGSSWWTHAEISALDHLSALRGAPTENIEGDVRNFVLGSGPGGVEIGRFRHNRNQTRFEPIGRSARSVAGLNISSINLTAAAEQDNTNSETQIGTVTANWDLPTDWQPQISQTTMPIYGLGPYAGYLVPRDGLNADFNHASPAEFNELAVGAEGVTAIGAVTPSLPLLSQLDISLELIGDDILFRTEYRPENLSLNFPGLNIDDGAIGLSYSKQQGFGVDGVVYVSVPDLGSGSLAAGFNQRDGISAEGTFNFDSELFDRASATLWYRNQAFGGEGTLGIDNPDKIRGIRSAEITVGFGEGRFTADGSVSPDIPGVEEAGLSVEYSEEEGLLIGGNLALNSDTPGIQSGSVEVTLRKLEGGWKVAATGTAVPDIPGIDSELQVDYNDGAFTAEVQAQYARGMLSGQIQAGVTNRGVDAETGELNETAEPNNPLIVYGGGELTIQIAPWLQGTAGVRFAPDGEITVSGAIGLPGALEIFPRREIDKSIFNIAVQAPIFPGIVAEIGGGLGATAGIGPGVIDQLELGITYNPAREEDTTITGDAHLRVPADAGLRLSVRAGIGLGITGASATGGLEVGGTLGIEGAAEAGVHVDWTPRRGLDLQATVAVYAQPAFTFDISGYVSVRALGFSVYDQTWELASFRYGSDYRFGIRLPIHYREGEPFDVSLDDVQFEVPEIDTDRMLRGLIARIA
ncbi:MAG: DUF4157 domain-containing protein [Desulfobacterales bacterium]|nr:DUF4157 domain-containing protein [Desulfobacterales bacterium]